MAKGGISKLVGSLFKSKDPHPDDELDLSIDVPDDEIYQPLVIAASTIRRDLSDTDVIDEEQLKRDRLFVVSVSEFYDAMGGRSGRLAESLPTVCESVFQKHRGPKDHYFWVNQDHFAMRFADMDDPNTFQKAGDIIEEIGIKLLGDHFIRTNKFQAIAALMTGAQLVKADGTADLDNIDAAMALVKQSPQTEAEKGPKWQPFRFATLIGKNKWLSFIKGKADDSPEWKRLKVEMNKRAADPADQWQVMQVEKPKKSDPSDQWTTLEVDKKVKGDPSDQWTTLEVDKKVKSDPADQWQVMEREKKTRN